jgi:hypothetical protein
VLKGGYLGKEADAGYRLCEQAIATDPNNARAPAWLSLKFFFTVIWELSADPKAGLERADELSSRAVVLDPTIGLTSQRLFHSMLRAAIS